ncbi:unnamed protein product [Mytilus coruscus]|uniref:Uncharacterized protein n=1 Tax=Mytilus coruscus TaxID=42192 RepID=A0A6J8BUF1_MYTCO|nr:unnamed protein product [Mytilus coruscus]
MFYSTNTTLIQGQKTDEWVHLEYSPLSMVIGDILSNNSKGNNSGAEVDKQIKIIPDNLLKQDGDKLNQEPDSSLTDSLIEQLDKTLPVTDNGGTGTSDKDETENLSKNDDSSTNTENVETEETTETSNNINENTSDTQNVMIETLLEKQNYRKRKQMICEQVYIC